MYQLLFLSLFVASGTLKGPSPEIKAPHPYVGKTQCETDAYRLNNLDLSYGDPGIRLRAVCIPAPWLEGK